MIQIEGNWENARDLYDISRIVRYYYNQDLADEMDKMIPDDNKCFNLESELKFKNEQIKVLEDDIYSLESEILSLEKEIDNLTKELKGE